MNPRPANQVIAYRSSFGVPYIPAIRYPVFPYMAPYTSFLSQTGCSNWTALDLTRKRNEVASILYTGRTLRDRNGVPVEIPLSDLSYVDSIVAQIDVSCRPAIPAYPYAYARPFYYAQPFSISPWPFIRFGGFGGRRWK